MKAMGVVITLALLAGCGILEPKRERVVVTLETCCEYDSDSVYVGVPWTVLVLGSGPDADLDHDSQRVEARVRSEHCTGLYVVLRRATLWTGVPLGEPETLFRLPLGGCGEFVLEVNWAKNLAVVRGF